MRAVITYVTTDCTRALPSVPKPREAHSTALLVPHGLVHRRRDRRRNQAHARIAAGHCTGEFLGKAALTEPRKVWETRGSGVGREHGRELTCCVERALVEDLNAAALELPEERALKELRTHD